MCPMSLMLGFDNTRPNGGFADCQFVNSTQMESSPISEFLVLVLPFFSLTIGKEVVGTAIEAPTPAQVFRCLTLPLTQVVSMSP